MRRHISWVKLLLGASLTLAACSVIVNPADFPEFCEAGTDCGDGLICANVEGDWRCIPGTSTSCLENPLFCDSQGYIPPRPFCRGDGQCVECLTSDSCVEGFYCLESWCRPGCDSEARCPQGYRCIESECTAPRDEVCDGVDNDLNGVIDDGLDGDGDGFSPCPTAPNPGDCNDASRDARPGGVEVCDGQDNDCVGGVDTGVLCDEGWVCTSGACMEIVDEGCRSDGECPDDYFCHPETRVCEPPARFGELCFKDAQCVDGNLCLDTMLLGQTGSHCTDMCCSNDDCPPDSICAENGSGLKLCAPVSWFTQRNVVCQFINRCQTCADPFTVDPGLGQRCVQQCCRDADCPDGSCQVVSSRNPATGDRKEAMLICDFWQEFFDAISQEGQREFDDCTEGMGEWCLSGMAWSGGGMCHCSSPCCNDADCQTTGHPRARCVLDSAPVSSCFDPELLGELGEIAFGEKTCNTWDDCQTGVCHPSGYCSQTCCPGDSCPGDYECRPVQIGGTSANLCTRDDTVASGG
jgi:hypothetical protein